MFQIILCHFSTEIDAIVLSVHERINGLLEDHSVKQLRSHVQKWLQSQQQ